MRGRQHLLQLHLGWRPHIHVIKPAAITASRYCQKSLRCGLFDKHCLAVAVFAGASDLINASSPDNNETPIQQGRASSQATRASGA